jgi:hypothetical protein
LRGRPATPTSRTPAPRTVPFAAGARTCSSARATMAGPASMGMLRLALGRREQARVRRLWALVCGPHPSNAHEPSPSGPVRSPGPRRAPSALAHSTPRGPGVCLERLFRQSPCACAGSTLIDIDVRILASPDIRHGGGPLGHSTTSVHEELVLMRHGDAPVAAIPSVELSRQHHGRRALTSEAECDLSMGPPPMKDAASMGHGVVAPFPSRRVPSGIVHLRGQPGPAGGSRPGAREHVRRRFLLPCGTTYGLPS